MNIPSVERRARKNWSTQTIRALTTPPQWALVQDASAREDQQHWLSTSILSRTRLTPHCVELELKKPRHWRGHRAGQHISLSIYCDGRRQERYYSLTHAPQDNSASLRIAVQGVDGGTVSQYLVKHAAVGQRVEISQARGDFALPVQRPQQKLLMLSAGSGITPIMSMLRALTADHKGLDIVHMHYARSPEDMIYAASLEEMETSAHGYKLCKNFTRRASAEQPGQRWSLEQQQQQCPDWQQRQAWACGPDAWLEQMEANWEQAGLGPQLYTERFFKPLPVLATGADQEHEVYFAHSEQQGTVPRGKTLLQAAEEQGLNPKYGCRMGICHSCDCSLQSGEVKDLRNGDILGTPGQRIQPCVCTPLSAVEIDL